MLTQGVRKQVQFVTLIITTMERYKTRDVSDIEHKKYYLMTDNKRVVYKGYVIKGVMKSRCD
jgi:hypothetical protein